MVAYAAAQDGGTNLDGHWNIWVTPARHLLKPCSGEMKQVIAGEALDAVLAAAQRPSSNEDSRTDRSSSLGGLRRSFVTYHQQKRRRAGVPLLRRAGPPDKCYMTLPLMIVAIT